MLITLVGRLVQFALLLVNIKVMTSLLVPTQYGLMSLYLAINLFFGFGQMWMPEQMAQVQVSERIEKAMI